MPLLAAFPLRYGLDGDFTFAPIRYSLCTGLLPVLSDRKAMSGTMLTIFDNIYKPKGRI